MNQKYPPFRASYVAMCAIPLLLAACGGGGGGGKAVKPSALTVVVGKGATSSAPVVLATDATRIDAAVGTTYPTYLHVARASGSDTSAVSSDMAYGAVADTLSVKVDGVTTNVQFGPASITEQGFDVISVENDGPDGLTYGMVIVGGDTLDYARFGFWERGNGDDLIQSNEVLAASYGGRETPVAAVPSSGSAIYSGTTAGIGISNAGEMGVMTGNVALTANFASASINGAITNISIDQSPADLRASLNGSIAQNSFNGTMDVTNRAGSQDVGSGQFDGRFFGPGAEELAGGWNYKGDDGTKAIGAFGAKR